MITNLREDLRLKLYFKGKTKSLIKGGVKKEALTTLHNIDRVLLAAGSHWNKVVKMTVTLQTCKLMFDDDLKPLLQLPSYRVMRL